MYQRLAIALSIALVIGWQVSATPKGVAQLVSSFTWEQPEDWFGGFSGIEVTKDGSAFSALTDSGTLVIADVKRDAGMIQSVQTRSNAPVKDKKGVIKREGNRDTEGLAIREDGRLFVSFEGRHRVFGYPKPDTKGTSLKRHPDFLKMERNGSLEALAIDGQGRLYTLAETPNDAWDNLPLYRFANGQWSQAFTLPARNGFRPVGADFGPDGLFYLLERKFNGLGFRTRVRRFDLSGAEPSDEETLLLTRMGVHDNLEGLAVWKDDLGHLRLTMISDDNFMFYQKTEIVEYLLPAS